MDLFMVNLQGRRRGKVMMMMIIIIVIIIMKIIIIVFKESNKVKNCSTNDGSP